MAERKLDKSNDLLRRAEQIIPRAAQTLSKAPDQFMRGVSPYAIERGKGCRVWDVDGNEYIDLSSSLGAIILGYRHPVVEEAVKKQREKGTIFTLPGDLEVELAEKIKSIIPFVEMIRFGINGSDATTGAIRVARAYTGRDHVAKCGYHGWADWTIATHPLRSKGIPQAVKDLTHEFKYGDVASLEKIFSDYPNQVAAVILEPMHSGLPDKEFLQAIKDLAHKNGTVLIFDEIVTGFRVSMGGVAGLCDVFPDLVCYGKSISNGEPISVFGGKKEIMSVLDGQDVFVSFTYAGYLPSIAAALAVLDFMQKNGVQKKIWDVGSVFLKSCQTLIEKHKIPVGVAGVGPLVGLTFKNNDGSDNLILKSLFMQETAKHGILTNTSNLINYSHDLSVVDEVVWRLDSIFGIMKKAVDENRVEAALEGPVIRPRSKPQ